MAALLAIPLLVSLVVLSGWISHIESLKKFWLPTVTMNPTTAIGLICLSVGLLMARRKSRGTALGSLALMAMPALLGLAKILDLTAGDGRGVDAWLFYAQEQAQDGGPSRIALNVAIDLTLLGAAGMLQHVRDLRALALAQAMAIAALVIAIFAVVGYFYDVVMFYKIAFYFPMALHSALCLIAVSAYILFETRDISLQMER